MLDLKELEKMVDEALAKETKESWNNWLEEQKMKELESFLGCGDTSSLENYQFTSFLEHENIEVSYTFKENSSDEPNRNYKNAA